MEVEDLPGQLAGCIHPADLCTAANHGYRLWRSRRQTVPGLSTLRAALTEQYSALAGALAQLAGKAGPGRSARPRREARVAQLFAELGLDALECSVTADLAGRLTANVTICRTQFHPGRGRGPDRRDDPHLPPRHGYARNHPLPHGHDAVLWRKTAVYR